MLLFIALALLVGFYFLFFIFFVSLVNWGLIAWFDLVEMEFDLEGFVDDPTIEKLDGCTVEHLKLIAGRYSVDVSKYGRKPVIKERLLSVLVEQGVLAAQGAISPCEPDEAGFNEQIRMKELELELRRLELREKEISLKEKEMTCHFEVKKLE